MKKSMFCMLLALLVIGCGKGKENDDTDNSGGMKGTTWAALVTEHPFLGDFPAYDNIIDNYTYNKTFSLESVAFFDYDCDKAEYAKYAGKLEAAGFEANPNMPSETSAIYSKTTESADLSVSMAYTTGSLAFVLGANAN